MYNRQTIFHRSVALKKLLDTLSGEVVKIMTTRKYTIPAKCGYFLYVFFKSCFISPFRAFRYYDLVFLTRGKTPSSQIPLA